MGPVNFKLHPRKPVLGTHGAPSPQAKLPFFTTLNLQRSKLNEGRLLYRGLSQQAKATLRCRKGTGVVDWEAT
ncbi:hypothetical protein FHT02_003950, partial [Sphingomonas xinjiangensis]|nr:hypothetical protein [Sphingomonas xinjiangensis]